MYLSYFGLDAPPFSIIPDHRALYMSQSHREAVAHLLYALNQSGGFVQLTGEVGTGKTTVSRYIMSNLPEDVDVALLLNPAINEQEMLQAICNELQIKYKKTSSNNELVDLLNNYLLKAHGEGRKTVLIIDEAQNLSREVLEQIRLLTNLETSTDKLLQIILIGQPELTMTLQRHDLRQLSQRIVGRFKLQPLNKNETRSYIEHRLHLHGVDRPLFTNPAISRIHQLSNGIPRLINVLCDRALLGAFSHSKQKVDAGMVNRAAGEVLDSRKTRGGGMRWMKYAAAVLLIVGSTVFIDQFIRVETGSGPVVTETESVEQNESGNNVRNTIQKEALQPMTSEQETLMLSDESVPEPGETKPFDLSFRLGVPLKNRQLEDHQSKDQPQKDQE